MAYEQFSRARAGNLAVRVDAVQSSPNTADATQGKRLRMRMHSSLAQVRPTVKKMLEFVRHLTSTHPRLQDDLQTALTEAMVNAIVHGNLELLDNRDRRYGGWQSYHALIAEREKRPEYGLRTVIAELSLTANRIKIVIRDEGRGFSPPPESELLDNESQILAMSGRGILMIRHCMDEVRWNAKGNEITMFKSLRPAE